MLTLVAPPAARPWPAPDGDQLAAVRHDGPALLVRGAPGSGKTTVALRRVHRLVTEGLTPSQVVLVAPTRRAAARLRDELSGRLGVTAGAPVVRTAASLAFSVLRARAVALGEPAPTLITGPEQDLVLADLLAGHAAGDGAAVAWPPQVPREALALAAFRSELRDLLMRAAERGLRPADLAALGERHARPAWVAAAAVYEEYLDVTRLRAGTPDAGARFDPAVVVDEAAEALAAWSHELPGIARPRWRAVVVDDYQEVTAATARLLHVLADDGAELTLLADTDAAVQTFRGARPGLVDRATDAVGSGLGAFGAAELVLGVVHRHGTVLREVVRSVTAQVRGPGRAQRAATSAEGAGQGGSGAREPDAREPDAQEPGMQEPGAEVRVLRSPAQESAYLAYRLRSARLHDGVPWHEMAVVVRSGAQVALLRRALLASGVPVLVLGGDVPLRAEPAVAPLLLALAVVLDPAALTAADAVALLTSPVGGTDPVGVRRLRRALRAEELAGGGTRPSDPLLLEALADPSRCVTLGAAGRPAARLARVLAAGRAATQEPGATVQDILWGLWSSAGLAGPWRTAALHGGTAGARADRDLDAVLALFAAAERFVERLPHAPAGAFLDHLRSQDLPADTLAASGDVGDAVRLLTAAGAAGGQWRVVAVAGVQDGTWPDLRLRDSLLGAQHLVEVLDGRAGAALDAAPALVASEARAAVLDDELRAFAVAVSRARERLIVTAVRDTDHEPSPLVDLVQPWDGVGVDPRVTDVPAALDLRAVVAAARSRLEADPDDTEAATVLARLAADEVEGAAPSSWPGLAERSSDDPLWPPQGPVPLSPSRLESASTCALRWALEGAGGTAAESRAQSLGLLVHAVAAARPSGTREELLALLDARWGELGLAEGWVSAVQRRKAEAMVGKLAGYLAGRPPVLGVELPFVVRLDRVVLRGSVDRLEQDEAGPSRVRVVDLKTGASAVSGADAARHPQLGAYQLAVEAGAFDQVAPGATSAGAELAYVGTSTASTSVRVQGALAEDTDPQWAARLVQDVADAVCRSVVAATVNEHCDRCPVRRSCPAVPAGQVVGR